MVFKTDVWGIAFKCNDAKLQINTWGNRLSQIGRQSGSIYIITYSLPDLDYVRRQLGRRPYDISIIAHEKFMDRAKEIKREFPRIEIAISEKVHSKVVLIEPKTIIVSSANFGSSRWHETTVSFHSNEAYDWYVKNAFFPIFGNSTILL